MAPANPNGRDSVPSLSGRERVQGTDGRVRVLIPQQDIDRRLDELAAAIDRDYASRVSAEEPLIAVGVLKGSVFFMVDLLKRVTIPLVVDFYQTSSYGQGMSPGEVRIKKDVELSLRGRDVLLIEDIVDTGHTLTTIFSLMRLRGARSLKLCALLDKHRAREVPVPIDYKGFEIENFFVVGYGLDYGERFRNLPYVGVWEPESPQGAGPTP